MCVFWNSFLFLLAIRYAFHYVCIVFLLGENEVFLTKVSWKENCRDICSWCKIFYSIWWQYLHIFIEILFLVCLVRREAPCRLSIETLCVWVCSGELGCWGRDNPVCCEQRPAAPCKSKSEAFCWLASGTSFQNLLLDLTRNQFHCVFCWPFGESERASAWGTGELCGAFYLVFKGWRSQRRTFQVRADIPSFLVRLRMLSTFSFPDLPCG